MTKRVAFYSRVSTTHQNVELQEREIKAYLQSKPDEYILIEGYSDIGISGSKSSRPELNRLLEDAKTGKFEVLIIWKMDRLGRSLSHLIKLVDDLKNCNVKIISVKDNLDFTTPSGELLFHLLGAMAQFERELIKERVISGLEAAKAKGIKLGREKDSDRDDDLIKDLRHQGLSIRAIAKKLGITGSKVQRSLGGKCIGKV